MDENPKNDNRLTWLWKSLIAILVIGLLYAAIPNFVHSGPSKRSGIFNNLRQIDAAKNQWAFEHGVTNLSQYNGQLSAKDLTPYILATLFDSNGVKHPLAHEIYTINSLGKFPEAKLTRELEGLPKGTIITFVTIDKSNNLAEHFILPSN
jgi:hypothetical protein